MHTIESLGLFFSYCTNVNTYAIVSCLLVNISTSNSTFNPLGGQYSVLFFQGIIRNHSNSVFNVTVL